jgi:hypothetical protein
MSLSPSPTGAARRRRVAVEVQDSPIAVDEVKRRTAADRNAGFFATAWVFTHNRLPGIWGVLPGNELRLPEEMHYVANRWGRPIAVLHVDAQTILLVGTAEAVRHGATWYDVNAEEERSTGGHRLKKTREVHTAVAEFALAALAGRYHTDTRHDWTAGFRPIEEPGDTWQVTTAEDDADERLYQQLNAPPTDLNDWSELTELADDGTFVLLTHTPTLRHWELAPARTRSGWRWMYRYTDGEDEW